MSAQFREHPMLVAPHVADAFVEDLGRVLRVAEISEIRRRNALRRDRPDEPCASHDFCDADAIMAASFERVVGRPARRDVPADAAIWRRAWQLARATYLTEPPKGRRP